MRGVSSGKQGSDRQSVGSPDRSPAPSAQAVWRGPEGRAWWPEGEKDGEEVERNSDRQIWGLYTHTHTYMYLYEPDIIYTHTHTHTHNRNTQTQTYTLTRLTTSLFFLFFLFCFAGTHALTHDSYVHTPFPRKHELVSSSLIWLAVVTVCRPLPPPSLTKAPRACIQTMHRPLQSCGVCPCAGDHMRLLHTECQLCPILGC